MFYTKLKIAYSNLTYLETKIADYILTNSDNLNDLTSKNLANLLNISQPTVIRFSKRLGYSSYRQLLLDLDKSKNEVEVVEEIQLSDSIDETNSKIRDRMKLLLDITYEMNNQVLFEQAIGIIRNTNVIFCYGYLSSGSMAHQMYSLLRLFGINAYYLDYHATLVGMRNFDERMTLMVFSKSGESATTNRLVKYARSKGIKTIGVTNSNPNSLSGLLDVWIKVAYSPIKTRFLNYSEITSHVFIINALILNLYKQDYLNFSDNVAEYNLITKNENKI